MELCCNGTVEKYYYSQYSCHPSQQLSFFPICFNIVNHGNTENFTRRDKKDWEWGIGKSGLVVFDTHLGLERSTRGPWTRIIQDCSVDDYHLRILPRVSPRAGGASENSSPFQNNDPATGNGAATAGNGVATAGKDVTTTGNDVVNAANVRNNATIEGNAATTAGNGITTGNDAVAARHSIVTAEIDVATIENDENNAGTVKNAATSAGNDAAAENNAAIGRNDAPVAAAAISRGKKEFFASLPKRYA